MAQLCMNILVFSIFWLFASANRIKRQYDSYVRIRTPNNQWTTNFHQPLDSLYTSGVPDIRLAGLPGPISTAVMPAALPYRAINAPHYYQYPVPISAGYQTAAYPAPLKIQLVEPQALPIPQTPQIDYAPLFKYLYPDSVVSRPRTNEQIGNAKDNNTPSSSHRHHHHRRHKRRHHKRASSTEESSLLIEHKPQLYV